MYYVERMKIWRFPTFCRTKTKLGPSLCVGGMRVKQYILEFSLRAGSGFSYSVLRRFSCKQTFLPCQLSSVRLIPNSRMGSTFRWPGHNINLSRAGVTPIGRKSLGRKSSQIKCTRRARYFSLNFKFQPWQLTINLNFCLQLLLERSSKKSSDGSDKQR